MRTMLALLVVLAAPASQAAPLTFQFDTRMDTTDFGGNTGTPLTVTYTFDSDLPDGSGTAQPPGSYGPLTMQMRLGNETVSASGGGILLWNDTADMTDGYDVRADDFSFSGQLFGRDITFFRFLLVDQDATMFNSTALPLTPGFAIAADFQQTEFDFADGSVLADDEFPDTPPEQRTPFTLTAVPEPSTIALVACGWLAILGRLVPHRGKRRSS